MANIKGLGIQSRIDFLRGRFGEDGLARVLAAMRPEHRELVEKPIPISSWYPVSLASDLLGSAELVLGKGDGAICRDIGALSCRRGLETVYRIFTHVEGIVEGIARTAPLLWRSYYDTGELRLRSSDEHALELELTGIALDAPWLCHLLCGYIEEHVRIQGGAHVSVTHPQCLCWGAAAGVWAARWS